MTLEFKSLPHASQELHIREKEGVRVTKKPVFAGYYGWKNTGDDAFCVVASHVSKCVWHASHAEFLSHELPHLPHPARALLQGTPTRLNWYRATKTAAISLNRHIVYFGGSTLSRLTTRRLAHLQMARRGWIDMSALGVSIGPFASESDSKAVADFLGHCSSVMVRDLASLDIAHDLGIEASLMYDPAVLLTESSWVSEGVEPSSQGLRQRPTVAVTFNDYFSHTAAGLAPSTRFGHVLKRVAQETNAEFKLIVMDGRHERGDLACMRRLAAQLEAAGVASEVVPYRSDIRHTLRVLRDADIVVGSRLHGAVIAYAFDRPFALIDYHRKCGDFVGTIDAPSEWLVDRYVEEPEAIAGRVVEQLEQKQRPGIHADVARAAALAGVRHLAERGTVCS